MSGPAPPRALAALGATALACAAHAAGCHLLSNEPAKPCNGLKEGDRLAITIVERRPPSPELPSNTTCNDLLGDLPVGTAFEAVLTGFEAGKSGNDNCLSGRATITRTGGWTWQVPGTMPRPVGSHAIEGRFDASRGTCTGTVDLRLSGTIPNGAPDAGMRARATFSRAFLRTAGDDQCPEACVGEFGVAVDKR